MEGSTKDEEGMTLVGMRLVKRAAPRETRDGEQFKSRNGLNDFDLVMEYRPVEASNG